MHILGLGSNLGHRKNNLRNALFYLFSSNQSPIKGKFNVSSIYESKALVPKGAPESWNKSYLNIAVSFESDIDLKSLHDFTTGAEKVLGRKNRENWAPREIDIDILYSDQETISSEKLIVPHKELENRSFAYLPLIEIYPEVKESIVLQKHDDSIKKLGGWYSQIWGILNVTPDSFSDGGRNFSRNQINETIKKMVVDGVDVIDIGAESTRPGAIELVDDEEIERLKVAFEVITELKKNGSDFPEISIDSRKPKVIEYALNKGIHWINDVTGFENLKTIELLSNSNVKGVLMHSLGAPVSRDRVLDPSLNPIEKIKSFFEDRIDLLISRGVPEDNLVLDPGIGFGKTPEQNWSLLNDIEKFRGLGRPLYVGHSRKSFLNQITEKEFSARDLETLTISSMLFRKKIEHIRVHDFKSHIDFQKALGWIRNG